jgi:inner membrane protein
MDPLSQAVAGAALSGSATRKKNIVPAALILGACSGMAPDLDIFIRSAHDPLLALEYHRHFTHSLAFVPLGGLLCAAFFYILPWFRKRLSFSQTYLFCALGVLTHGLLDSCTGYGTHLLWPFSMVRESWNIIGIIDPFYTIPAFLMLVIAAYKPSISLVRLSAIWMLAYLGLGSLQHYRATVQMEEWLEVNETRYEALTLRPTIGNLWLWRVVYRDNEHGHWQTHALYLPFWSGEAAIREGGTAERVPQTLFDHYPEGTVAGDDLRRFDFFSAGYLSYHPNAEEQGYYIGDIRYGMTPDSAKPLWGIVMPEDSNDHVTRLRSLRERVNWLKVEALLTGQNFTPIRPIE